MSDYAPNVDPMLEAALTYARMGFHVFPVGPTRVPFAKTRGFYDATTSPDRVAEYWRTHPCANIAIRTGTMGARDTILCVIDIDPRNDGPVHWTKILAGRHLPETLHATSGRDGTHFYFLIPKDTETPNELTTGVDVKCDGGYVVAAPSSHEKGHAYSWDNWGAAVALAPDWLLDEIREAAREQRRWEKRLDGGLPESIIHGGRDVVLTKIAGKMRRIGFSASEIHAALHKLNIDRCKPPLEDRQVSKICASIGRYDPAEDLSAGSGVIVATVAVTGVELAKALPPLEYLSKNLALVAGSGAPHGFYGFGFSGKTVVVQSMNLSLTALMPIWGVYDVPTSPQRVSHVDNEQGIALTQRRYQRLAASMGIDLTQIGDLLRVFVFPKLRSGKRVTLCPEHRNAWAEMMAERDLMVVDSFAASRDGNVKENESEVRRGLDMLGEISEETHCRPLVIHHATKGADDEQGAPKDPRLVLRGSGAIFDAMDGTYYLSGVKGEPVLVAHTKARSHGEPVDSLALDIEDLASDMDPRWGLQVKVHGVELIDERRAAIQNAKAESERILDAQRIRNALSGGKRLMRNDLAACARLNGGRFSRAWTYLMETGEGQTEIMKAGRTTKHIHYLVSK